jgi:hypothetical protein
MQNGLPYSALTSGTPTGGLYGSINGSGGTTTIGGRGIPGIGRNTYRLPNTYVADVRVGKNFGFDTLDQHFNLELMAEMFNVANHQNVTQQNTTAYAISGTKMTYNTVFGANQNANNNYSYTPRQMQLGIRLKF